MLALLFLARVVLSVSGNAVQKQLLFHRSGAYRVWIITYLLMLIPACLAAVILGAKLNSSFLVNIALGGVLDACGNVAMLAALRTTDLSIFGPLNALRPALALLFGWLFLAELPSFAGGLGVFITIAGTALLLKGESQSPHLGGRQLATLGFRVLGISLSAFGAVFLKRAVLQSTPETTLAGWILFGLVSLLALAAARQKGDLSDLPRTFHANRTLLLAHALLFLVMQWLTIRIFQQALVAYAFVFFQFAIILQLIVGRIHFGEKAFQPQRVAGCVIMAIGSALILWKG